MATNGHISFASRGQILSSFSILKPLVAAYAKRNICRASEASFWVLYTQQYREQGDQQHLGDSSSGNSDQRFFDIWWWPCCCKLAFPKIGFHRCRTRTVAELAFALCCKRLIVQHSCTSGNRLTIRAVEEQFSASTECYNSLLHTVSTFCFFSTMKTFIPTFLKENYQRMPRSFILS